MELAESFFAKEEYDFILEETEEKAEEKFFRVWTAKESYIKAVGKGLTIPLDSFSTVANGNIITQDIIDGSKWYYKEVDLDPGYFITVCSANPVFSENIEIIDVQSLL